MILERTVMQCKPGTVRQVVENFKNVGGMMANQDVIKSFRILTGLSGPFDTVVIESEIESIDAYYTLLHSMFAEEDNEDEEEMLASYNTGTRTFYTIEAKFE
jgi:hypothetical protein